MPQKTLFDGWNIDGMTIRVHLNVNKPGGRLDVEFTDELGKFAGSRGVRWTKDHDLADLGLVLRDVGNAFMWAPQLEMTTEVQRAFRRHCPEVPSGS